MIFSVSRGLHRDYGATGRIGCNELVSPSCDVDESAPPITSGRLNRAAGQVEGEHYRVSVEVGRDAGAGALTVDMAFEARGQAVLRFDLADKVGDG